MDLTHRAEVLQCGMVGLIPGIAGEPGGRDRSPVFFAQENDFLWQNELKTGYFLRVLITIS
jgi:hypothetical protein